MVKKATELKCITLQRTALHLRSTWRRVEIGLRSLSPLSSPYNLARWIWIYLFLKTAHFHNHAFVVAPWILILTTVKCQFSRPVLRNGDEIPSQCHVLFYSTLKLCGVYNGHCFCEFSVKNVSSGKTGSKATQWTPEEWILGDCQVRTTQLFFYKLL